MARKKFAIRSLFSARATKSGVEEQAEPEYASESDDLNDAHPFDPTQVNRPPRLDDRTEADLRRACAIIVENLKPSGYDLEDTRMQSDILVNNSDLTNPRDYPSKPNPPVPQPDATWYLDASTRSSQFVNPRNVVKSPDKRASTYRISGIASEHDLPHERYSKLLDPQDTSPHHPIDHTESPRAPLASGALPSRDLASPLPKQVSYVKSLSDPLNPSSSSAVPDNRPPSSSTTASSTNRTPLSISQQASDTARLDMAAGSQSRSAISTRDSNLSSDDPAASQVQVVGEAQAVQIRNGRILKSSRDQVRLTNIRSPSSVSQTLLSTGAKDSANTRITSGTLSGPFEQPQLVDDIAKHSNTSRTLQSRPDSSQDAALLAEDYQNSIMTDQKPTASSIVSLDESRLKGSDTNSRRVSNPLNRPISMSSQKSDSSKRGSKALSPTSPTFPGFPKSTQNLSAPYNPSHPENEIPQIPPIPDKHQLDESIVVKDFYKPAGVSRMKLYRRSGASERNPAQPGDVEAADFDSFMSVVKDASRPNTAVSKAESIPTASSLKQPNSKPSDNSTPAAVSRPISSSEPVLSQKDNEQKINPESSSEAVSSPAKDLTDSNPQSRPQSQRSPPQESKVITAYNQPIQRTIEVKDLPQDQQRQSLSAPIVSIAQHDVSSPVVVSSSRTSISTPLPMSPHSRSASMTKPNRGLKRLLSKLGSNDRTAVPVNVYNSSRRKYIEGFAPGAYIPGHGFNGGIEENDEWLDEQACAAPVVGFGRGW